MAVILFFAMFLGSLLAAFLVFSGWPLWFAFSAYLLCGLTGLGLMLMSNLPQAVLRKAMLKVKSSISELSFFKNRSANFSEPQTVPDLSEYLFSTTRK